MAAQKLYNELKLLQKEPWTKVEVIHDNVFEWSVALIPLASDSPYYGGYYKARMSFPRNYPYSPPDFKFERSLYHPNIYPDGRLCISILHQPGEDAMSGESAEERWSPVQTVETVLMSVLSLLDDAEISSPANIKASTDYRDNRAAYNLKVAEAVAESRKDIPEGFVMPTSEAVFVKQDMDTDRYSNFSNSDDEESFGGSDSDPDENRDDTGTEEDEDYDEDDEDEENDEDGKDGESMDV